MDKICIDEDSDCSVAKKNSFKFKKGDDGIILNVHHTTTKDNCIVRVRFTRASFSENSLSFVAVDHRGNIFVFDLKEKKFWKLPQQIAKCKTITYIPHKLSELMLATKDGKLYIVDVHSGNILRYGKFSNSSIEGVSFPGSGTTIKEDSNFLIYTQRESILINLRNFEQTFRLEHDQNKHLIKFVSFIPCNDKIFACFSNDVVHIWSGTTLKTIRTINPIRMRDKMIRSKHAIELCISSELNTDFDVALKHIIRDFSNGLLNSFSFSLDGRHLCLTTVDDFIIILSCSTYDAVKVIKLKDNMIQATCFMPSTSDMLLFLHTSTFDTVLIDCNNTAVKALIQDGSSYRMNVSNNGKLLYIILKTGEINIYNTAGIVNSLKNTQNIQNIAKEAKDIDEIKVDYVSDEMKKVLSRKRLVPILREYGEYPGKYRPIIWRFLLDLPCNRIYFTELLKKGLHPTVHDYDQKFPLKDVAALRNLKKTMSCLAYFCKVFGHCEFLPSFIFPFLKIFPNSLILSFELILTIVINHCQLWFEFAPVEPMNYLGIIENILIHFDPELVEFYKSHQIGPKTYAWSLASTSFSEVLDEKQWYQLWDNLLTSESYYLIFAIVGYNLVQKPLIMRLESSESVESFFSDQNIVDMKKFIKRISSVGERCPEVLHPKRYMKKLEKLPKDFYPKFENYPKDWVELKDNEMETLRLERELLDKKIRELEKTERNLAQTLEEGIRQEEHEKRLKEVEKIYEETLAREEERVGCQRKLLLIYQKQVRDRKEKVLNLVRESAYKRNLNARENELDTLIRNIERNRLREDAEMMFADEQLKMCELDMLSEKYELEQELLSTECFPERYRAAIDKLQVEKMKLAEELQNLKKIKCKSSKGDVDSVTKKIYALDNMLDKVRSEYLHASQYELHERDNVEFLTVLEKKINSLEREATALMESLTK